MSDHAATLHEAARIVAAKGAVHMPELIELLKPHSPGPEVTEKLEAQLVRAKESSPFISFAEAIGVPEIDLSGKTAEKMARRKLPKAAPADEDGA